MYTLVDGVEFYDKDEVDDIVRAITGGSLPNEDGIRNELTTKIEAEATAREQADTRLSTELGTRIDEEVAAREAATAANKALIDTETQTRAAVDTLLSNQLAAIEQLHTTLIGPNGFVDSDGDTVKANDSGKSIRQIANEEFYRQLITDADNVKTQLDTIKELADYLQQNPSIITDMYSKLGITWSIDNPTDFGTFDFSGVLTATNVDDAVLELYNTFTDKIGDLKQLTTTFKDSIVGAVNELDADIGNEVTARTDADSALGTRIDGEVTAREQADTQLGTRIDTEVGTLSALTTTAKDSIVGAVNELDADIGNEVTARTDADTALGTRIDGEVTAREQADTALGTRIDGEVTARTDADTALGTRIDTEVGTLSALTTTAKDNVVAAINEVNGKVGAGGGDTGSTASNCEQFTFVVDSNEKLTAWANNDKASGQDYTSVLIRKGEWTSTTGVNLTTAGTKVVVGEPGSKLVFNNVEKGLYYDPVQAGSDRYMRGVTAVGGTGTGNAHGYGFYLCTNLTNCTGTGTGNGSDNGYGFYACTNLTNCTGTGTGTGNDSGSGNGYGFYACTNLTNCTGTGNGSGSSVGFYLCINLTNCTGTGTSTGNNVSAGFYSCINLTNCTGSGSGTGSGVSAGFMVCTNLTNCTGTGTGTGTGSSSGYGFYSCKTVIGCKAGKRCSTAVFQECYASSSETSAYACADTANGGFNNTTNP